MGGGGKIPLLGQTPNIYPHDVIHYITNFENFIFGHFGLIECASTEVVSGNNVYS